MVASGSMVNRPDDMHPAISEAYNASDLEALVSLYEPTASFVIKPGRVTQGPAELRAALQRLIETRGRLTITPQTFIQSSDLVLALGAFTHSGRRRDGTPFELTSRFADVLRRQPDGRWLVAVDNGFAGE
jgi:ketosteroid isomerase-like protein